MAQSLLHKNQDNAQQEIIMMEFDEKETFAISLEEDASGNDRVVIKFNKLANCELDLSSQQARVLATELIMAANRAEVRENLKRKEHLVRKGQTPSIINRRRSMLQYVLQNNLISRPNWRG